MRTIKLILAAAFIAVLAVGFHRMIRTTTLLYAAVSTTMSDLRAHPGLGFIRQLDIAWRRQVWFP